MVIGAVVVLLILGAVGYMVMGKNKSGDKMTTPTEAPAQGGVISSIKDALSGSATLQCDYTDEDGRKTMAYVKNGMVRADVTATKPEESGSMILKDKKLYFWTAKGGFVMEAPDTDSVMKETEESNQGTEVMTSLEKYKQYCKTGTVSDSVFTPPTNVKFQDLSEMMKMMAPSGTKTTTPTGYDQKQVEEMMKQYQNPSQ